MGTLVVSDFGSSTTNTLRSRSNIPFDKISMTPTYRPPEYDFGERLGSRADDIWSLGCVLLELVCWGLGGGEMVKSFAQDRISPYRNAIVSDMFFEATVVSNGRQLVRVKRQVSEVSRILPTRLDPNPDKSTSVLVSSIDMRAAPDSITIFSMPSKMTCLLSFRQKGSELPQLSYSRSTADCTLWSKRSMAIAPNHVPTLEQCNRSHL